MQPPSHAVFPSPIQGTKRQLKVELLGAVKSRGLDTLSKNLKTDPNSKTLNPKQKQKHSDLDLYGCELLTRSVRYTRPGGGGGGH